MANVAVTAGNPKHKKLMGDFRAQLIYSSYHIHCNVKSKAGDD
jgi:hypothetical protein